MPRLLLVLVVLAVCLRARGEGGPPAVSSSTGPRPARPVREAAGGRAEALAGRPEGSWTAPVGPARVWFQAGRPSRHVLVWTPGGGGGGGPSAAAAAAGLLYDVQYKRYGNHSWTPVPRCSAIASRRCDLSGETREPRRRYYARVRALAGAAASPWTRTAAPLSPDEATLQLWNMSLSLSGNKIQVTLESPVHRWENATVARENTHPGRWVQYRVYVRRTSDNFQYVLVNNSLAFDLPELLWGEQYCVHVEACLLSWPNRTKQTEEQCISTPPVQGSDPQTTVTLSSALLSLVALGVVVMVWVCTYIKKPMEMPSVLKSSWVLRKHTSPGLRDMGLCWAVEPIHQISVGLKDHSHSDSRNKTGGADWLLPEKMTCPLPAVWASGQAEGPRLGDLPDSSGGSTDSGICLQDPVGSLSCLLPPGPLGCWGQFLLGGSAKGSICKDHFHAGEGHLLPAAPSSRTSEPVVLASEGGLKHVSPPQAQASGYQRQLGALGEMVDFSMYSTSSEGTAHAKPALASGYVKQAPGVVPSAPGPLAVPPESGLGTFLGSTSPCRWHHRSSMASGAVQFLPDFPKALLVPGLLEQESDRSPPPPPQLSLRHSSVHLSLSPPWCWV